jgi:hypothetical protein
MNKGENETNEQRRGEGKGRKEKKNRIIYSNAGIDFLTQLVLCI